MADQTVQFSFAIGKSQPDGWAVLWDVERVARCIPGCEEVETCEPGKLYRAKVRRKLGPFFVRMSVAIEVLETVPSEHLQVQISGNDEKLKSRVRQLLTVALRAGGADETLVDIRNSLALEGLLASLSRPLIGMQVTQVLEEFASNFRAAVESAAAAR
jgi:carbon monoxide dehydrogenase subunit G